MYVFHIFNEQDILVNTRFQRTIQCKDTRFQQQPSIKRKIIAPFCSFLLFSPHICFCQETRPSACFSEAHGAQKRAEIRARYENSILSLIISEVNILTECVLLSKCPLVPIKTEKRWLSAM
jgi:hypothetical protein